MKINIKLIKPEVGEVMFKRWGDVFLADVRFGIRRKYPWYEEIVLRGRGVAETAERTAEAEQHRHRLVAQKHCRGYSSLSQYYLKRYFISSSYPKYPKVEIF